MSGIVTSRSRVRHLASLIEHDIHRKGLSAGEPYRTANEVGQDLGVHPQMANRAMRLLAHGGLLVRKRGQGTFVGAKIRALPSAGLKYTHIFIEPSAVRQGVPVGKLLEGLLDELPGYDPQFNYLPPYNPVAYVRKVLQQGAADGSLSGLILASCPREVQEAVLESKLPAVVLGSVYPNTSRLPSVEADQLRMGRMLTQYLLERDHRRIGLLMHEKWMPGDNLFVDGVNRTLAETLSSHNGLTIRSIPLDASLVTNEVKRLLSAEDRPTGLICGRRCFAEAAVEAAESLGLAVPDEVDVVFRDYGNESTAALKLPRACLESDFLALAAVVGRMLCQLIDGQRPEPDHVILPVHLVEPTGGNSDQEPSKLSPAAGRRRDKSSSCLQRSI